jgi:hypothetical protein
MAIQGKVNAKSKCKVSGSKGVENANSRHSDTAIPTEVSESNAIGG